MLSSSLFADIPLSVILKFTPQQIRVINAPFDISQPHALLLFLLKNDPSPQQLTQILTQPQPRQICQILVQKSSSLYENFVHQLTNPNLWTILSLTLRPSPSVLTFLMNAFFDTVNSLKQQVLDTAQRQSLASQTRKNIFNYFKIVVKADCHSLLNSVFLQTYLPAPEDNYSLPMEDLFKLIQLIHSKQPYVISGQLEKSLKFKKDLLAGLNDIYSLHSALLCANVYAQMANIYGDEKHPAAATFLNLYNTLNAFGIHLIKDVWDSFSVITNSTDKLNFLSAQNLMDILMRKVWRHKNENVPKFCLKSFLKSTLVDANTLFTEYPEFVYGSMMQILNSGQFYMDCPLYMDSKFLKYVINFYTSGFKAMPQNQIAKNVKLYVRGIIKNLTYDHAVPTFLLVFKYLNTVSEALEAEDVQNLVELVSKVYPSTHVRKRWQMLDGLLFCLQRHTTKIPLKTMSQALLLFSDQVFEWNFVYDSILVKSSDPINTFQQHNEVHECFLAKQRTRHLIESKYPKQEIDQYFKQISAGSLTKLQLVPIVYKIVTIFKDNSLTPDVNRLIADLSNTCYAKQDDLILGIHHLDHFLGLESTVFLDFDSALTVISDYIQKIFSDPVLVLRVMQKLTRCLFSEISNMRGEDAIRRGRQGMAKFTEWLIQSKILNLPDEKAREMLPWMMEILVIILKNHCINPQYQYFIEESLYELYERLESIKQVRGIRLRIEIFLSLLMDNDMNFKMKNPRLEKFLADPVDLVDKYDYKKASELSLFLKLAVIPAVIRENDVKKMDEMQRALRVAMVTSLGQSVTKDDIKGWCRMTFDKRIVIWKQALELGYLLKWVQQAIQIGGQYLLFRRATVDLIFNTFYLENQYIKENGLYSFFVPIFKILSLVEEYRGFDGQILLKEFEEDNLVISQMKLKLPPKAEYYGAYPRYLFMAYFSKILEKETIDLHEQNLLNEIAKSIIKDTLSGNLSIRMLFTPAFRTRLREWQLINIIAPLYLRPECQLAQKQFNSFVYPSIIPLVEIQNQPQIRHYVELFCTKLLLAKPQESSKTMVVKLKESYNSSMCIPYVIMGGLLLRKHWDIDLYNGLLGYVCSHTAYLRGLTQYFAFHRFQQISHHFEGSKIIQQLYKQYEENPDSVRLVKRIAVLIEGYKSLMNNWDIKHLYTLQFAKTGEACEEYHLESLKTIGMEIVREIKQAGDTFVGLKDAWKKEVEAHNMDYYKEESKVFQRKYDPMLEEVYDIGDRPEAKTKLRILASNIQQIHNYGHLARTSEIFSVEQLAIHDLSILDDDRFKSVSCSGEKWLNVVQAARGEEYLEYIGKCLLQGYVPVLISDNPVYQKPDKMKLPFKCLLILGDESKAVSASVSALSAARCHVGSNLSVHVEAAIFIWCYVRQHLIP